VCSLSWKELCVCIFDVDICGREREFYIHYTICFNSTLEDLPFSTMKFAVFPPTCCGDVSLLIDDIKLLSLDFSLLCGQILQK
jgi:hypothetical protein